MDGSDLTDRVKPGFPETAPSVGIFCSLIFWMFIGMRLRAKKPQYLP